MNVSVMDENERTTRTGREIDRKHSVRAGENREGKKRNRHIQKSVNATELEQEAGGSERAEENLERGKKRDSL